MSDLTTIRTGFSFSQTVERVVASIKEKEFTLFSRIQHGEEAVCRGMSLRPTELIIFGNPEVGGLLMQERQTTGIDLPVKILVWEDAAGDVHLSYNRMSALAAKHNLPESSKKILERIEKVVGDICEQAAS